MWHKKQKNMMVPGQMMGPPPGPQALHMENMILPPPPGLSNVDFLAESSRKRKATPLDQQGFNISGSISGYCLPRESNPQHKVGVLLGSNVQGNTLGVFSNQTFLTGEPNSFGHKFGNYQFRDLNNFPASWQTNDGNFPKAAAVEKMNKSCSSMQHQSFHQKGWSPLIKSPVGEILSVPNWQLQAHNMVSQTEAFKSSYLIPSNTFSEKAQAGSSLKDGMSFGRGDHIVKDNPTMEMHSTPFENLRSLEVSQPRLIKSDEFDATLIGKVSFQDSKFGSSFEVKQSGQSLNTPGTKDISSVERGTLGAPCTEGEEIDRSYHNYEVQPGSSSSGMGLGDNLKDKDQGIGDGNVKIMKETEGSDMENVKRFSGEEMAPENAGSPAKILIGQRHRDDQSRGSLMLDEKVKSHAGNVAPIIVEKLWDGSLQLNASVTVSAVAFFKSGEKVPEVNWPKFVEVKGKVKLEAFEKYIQELPRSRNRGLMVISLCWNAGSSKAGLTGMKEVAKGYKEGERVGFAQLSSGIDLYVCPRSDTIITILAKYGFFKGMAAVQDDQDSLIGCVVWRRNRTSNSVAKKSERKKNNLSEQPLDSRSDSAIQRGEERNSSLTQPAQDSSLLVSVTGCTALESAESTGIENKNIQSSEVQLEVANSFTGANPMLTTSVPNNSLAISVELQTAPHSDSSSIQGPMGQFLQVEVLRSAEPEKSDVSLELQRPILPAASEIIKQQHRPALEDDDLPEFDFKTACGVSQSPVSKPMLSINNRNVIDGAPFDKKLQAEGFMMYGLLPPVMPIVQLTTANFQRRSENSTFPGLALDANQGIPPLKKLGERQPQTLVLPLMEEKHIVKSSEMLNRPGNVDSNQRMPPLKKLGEHESQASGSPLLAEKHALKSNEFLNRPGTVKPASGTAVPQPKNLWDDDDDMPEWCPPDLEPQNQPPAEATTRPSIPCIPFRHPKSTLEKLPPGPPPPLRPSSQVPIPPPFYPQGFPRGYHCPITITVKPAQARPVVGYVQRGPSSSSEFYSNPNSRPQFNAFEVKPPIRPAGWRGWRH